MARFNALDEGRKGFISINDIRKSLKVTVKHFWINLNFQVMEELSLNGVGLCCNGSLDPGRAHKGRADTRAAERVGHQQERAGGGGGIPTNDVCTQGKIHNHHWPVVKPVHGSDLKCGLFPPSSIPIKQLLASIRFHIFDSWPPMLLSDPSPGPSLTRGSPRWQRWITR